MSAFGRFWSLKVRGCTVGEHAVLNREGDRHHEKTGLSYPGRYSLSFELECSKRYISEINRSLEFKQFLLREPRFNADGVQTTNLYKLNFDRWFPFHSDEVEREQKKLLAYFRHAVKDPEFAQGFHSLWLEKPYFPTQHKKPEKNRFRQKGRSPRRRLIRPIGTRLWIALQSEGHAQYLEHHWTQIANEIEKDTGLRYDIHRLKIWMEK